MCGLAGKIARERRSRESLLAIANRMNTTLRHRGPDRDGTWVAPGERGVLGFARLAIQDLSPAADQPMLSASGRYAIVFNGEIYNCDELRRSIGRDAGSFRTHSDTEVLLASIEKLGLDATLRAANGMIALALWDTTTGSVFLARDRFGKKPLHYYTGPDHVSFASEIKALLAVEDFDRTPLPQALETYFALTYIPAPLSIFGSVRKVRPGHILEIRSDLTLTERSYWDLNEMLAGRGTRQHFSSELVTRAGELLTEATQRRLVSDVPVGVLLSGGVDSTLVAFTIAKRLRVPLKTFTIGLEDQNIDELGHARKIAASIGLENIALTLSQKEALGLVENVVRQLDEPFGDYSAIPTYVVSRLAREHVTVALSGDGGDEVFGGYTRYEWGVGWRSLMARAYAATKTAGLSDLDVALAVYARLMTQDPAGAPIPAEQLRRFLGLVNSPLEGVPPRSVLQYLRYFDFRLYLPDDILAKVDRASMASSLEVRSPFLDPELVAMSWKLADDCFVHGSERKRITRALFTAAFGGELLQQRKFGFGLPMRDWLVGPLREQVDAAVDEVARRPEVCVFAGEPRAAWQRVLAGEERSVFRVWLIYAFWRWSQQWQSASLQEAACR